MLYFVNPIKSRSIVQTAFMEKCFKHRELFHSGIDLMGKVLEKF